MDDPAVVLEHRLTMIEQGLAALTRAVEAVQATLTTWSAASRAEADLVSRLQAELHQHVRDEDARLTRLRADLVAVSESVAAHHHADEQREAGRQAQVRLGRLAWALGGGAVGLLFALIPLLIHWGVL